MQKFLILIFLCCTICWAQSQKEDLQNIKKESPYALLTEDYGILNGKDLKINACIADPVSFSSQNQESFYPYWQCFEVKASKMVCERGKYDRDEKSIMSMLVLSGTRNGERHEFISRRPISLSTCRSYKKSWHQLTKNEKYVCISGEMNQKEIRGTKIIWNWIFGRYKTQKGCDSYFQNECDGTSFCQPSP